MSIARVGKQAGSTLSRRIDRVGRSLVQVGFLLLFLYPLLPVLYGRLAAQQAPALASWLLPWDPLLLLGHLVHRDISSLVLGGPLLLLALTAFFGRFFCGWICPMGTVLDAVHGVRDGVTCLFRGTGARPRGARPALRYWFRRDANSPARYLVLLAVLAGGVLSLQPLGALDPLVIFHRTATLVTWDAFALQKPLLRIYLTASGIFLGLVLLEWWQPRFWCRHLCPLGALFNLTARRSLLNRRVDEACTGCGACRRACPMQAIPIEGHDTLYGDCHLCLACESACPQGAISFGLNGLAGKRWQAQSRERGRDGRLRLRGRYMPDSVRLDFSRRTFVAGLVAGAAGLAVPPALRAAPSQVPVIRPPGALPEADFLRTCILCQECVRVCPTTALQPVNYLSGKAGLGTPHLLPRQGGCLLNTSCPNLCAAACPAGAIRKTAPDKMKLGLAHVDRAACLAWDQGAKCLVCVEACPTGAAQPYNGRVTVDPQTCSGCGRCEQTCPVADAAIHVRPL